MGCEKMNWNDFYKNPIEFTSRFKLFNIFPGEWESVFKGEGIEFAEIRPFEVGDRPRDINLLTLAQTGEEEVVLREETRQLKVYVWADFSASMAKENNLFPLKGVIRDIAIGTILFSANVAYSPVSLFAFGIDPPKFFPPKLGEEYCFEIWQWICNEAPAKGSSSGVEKALAELSARAVSRNMVFFVSDFQQKFFEEDFYIRIRNIVPRFDFIPVVVLDPLEAGERTLPCAARFRVASSGAAREIYLDKELLRKIQSIIIGHREHLLTEFGRLGISPLFLTSPFVDTCAKDFIRYFAQMRKKEK